MRLFNFNIDGTIDSTLFTSDSNSPATISTEISASHLASKSKVFSHVTLVDHSSPAIYAGYNTSLDAKPDATNPLKVNYSLSAPISGDEINGEAGGANVTRKVVAHAITLANGDFEG